MRVRSAHFEVLSDAAPERARAVAVGLERFGPAAPATQVAGQMRMLPVGARPRGIGFSPDSKQLAVSFGREVKDSGIVVVEQFVIN